MPRNAGDGPEFGARERGERMAYKVVDRAKKEVYDRLY